MARKIDPVTGELVEADAFETEFSGDIDSDESGGIIQGPTPEMPFKFTEQALNPRAQAATGMAQRDPRARSAFTGIDPNAPTPGQQQAQMSEEDRNYKIGEMFGLSRGKVDEAMNPQFSNWHMRPRGSEASRSDLLAPKAYKKSNKGMQEWAKLNELKPGSGEALSSYYNELKRQQAEGPGKPMGPRYDRSGQLNEKYRNYSMKKQQTKMLASSRARGLNDEQRIFRTFMAMSPEAQANVDFKDERFMRAMFKAGDNTPMWMEGFGKESANKQKNIIRKLKPSKSGNLIGKIGKAVVLGGFSALMGGALAGPLMGAFGSTLGGGLAGASTGVIGSGMNQLIAGEFNPQGMATAAGLGFAGGAAGGGLFGGGSGAGQSVEAANLAPQVSQTQGGLGGAFQSIKGFAKPITDFLGTPGGAVLKSAVKGGIGAGMGHIQQGDVPEFESQGGTGLSTNMFSAQSQGLGGQQSRFQRRPDDPFYEAPTDLESAQGELV